MATKRIEASKQRLVDKICDVKEYLETNNYDVNELIRLKKNLDKKKNQFEKDLVVYCDATEKEEERIIQYEEIQVQAEDVLDDLEHYTDVGEQQKQEQMKMKEEKEKAEERRLERETAERRLEAEEKEKDRQFQLEKEKLELEEMKVKASMEEKIAIERLHLEMKKVETEEKIHTLKQNEKLSVRLPKLDPKKFDGNILKWTEFWDSFEATINSNKSLHDVDKFNYLKNQLSGNASEVISGLELTKDNYKIAVELLKERYGKEQVMVDAHYATLMNLPKTTFKTTSLRSFYDTTEKHLRCLRSLGQDDNQMQVLSMLKSKLPRSVIAKLEEWKPEEEKWTVQSFRKLLKRYINAQEAADLQAKLSSDKYEEHSKLSNGPSTRNHYSNSTHSTGEGLFANGNTKQRFKRKCIFCGNEHWSDECRKFPDITTRRKSLKNRCFKCMKEDHKAKDCKVVGKVCAHCGEKDKHHRTLCPKKFKQETSAGSTMVAGDVVAEEEISPNEETTSHEESTLLSAGEHVVMQTALVEAMSTDHSSSEVTRLLMDTGSSRTYVTEDIVKRLNLQSNESSKLTIHTFGVSKPKEITSKVVKLTLKSKEGNTIKIIANVVPKISGNIQRLPIKLKNRFSIQKRFKLADTLPEQAESTTIGILIGNDYYNEVMSPERVNVQEGLYLVKSKFGWIISGKTKTNERSRSDSAMFVMTHSSTRILPELQQFHKTDDSLPTQPNIDDLWKLETIGVTTPEDKKEDEAAMESFNNSVKKVDGRYEVAWPWKDATTKIPENYELSMGRLKTLHKRLADDPKLLNQYDQIIKNQLEKGMIEVVDEHTLKGEKRHYIPHHAVIKPDSNTTKVRVVYDASAKTKKTNPSLNESLYRGPVILEDLCGLLMRFRMKRIGMVADIEKAFLQIGLQPMERDVTRFLWLNDINLPVTPSNVVTYRFTRVPWGIISSPFLLGATIKHHLETENSAQTKNIIKSIYVDNLITGADDEKEANQLYRDSKESFKKISMNLREWKSSSEEVNQMFQKDQQIDGSNIKVLGLRWDTKRDRMSIDTDKFYKRMVATTKREVLASIASLYDPLGYLAPVTMKMRLFLQQLWNKEKDWDDQMDKEDIESWRQIVEEANALTSIDVPRYIGKEKSQLICFCDASKNAYATAIYLKTMDQGQSKVNLIFAKSRIAPKKTMSIPRLELLALLIGIRSLKFVSKELELENTQKIVWTDSQCVLHWLKSSKPLSTFVKNRIAEITEEKNVEFRYINTKDNPADIPSRGMSSEDLQSCKLWWNGPDWLKDDISSWPTWNVEKVDQNTIQMIQSEVKGPTTLYEATILAQEPKELKEEPNRIEKPFGLDEQKYSTYNKVLRITAYINRFIQKLRKRSTQKGLLTSEELDESRILWIKYLQKKHYTVNENGKTKLTKAVASSQLNPRMDDDGIIRCYGRFVNADLPQDTITPILLPRNEKFVKLLIEDYHRSLQHARVNHTLSQIRSKYWIQRGRAEVKRVLKECKICRKYQGGPFKMPPMSPWPKNKLTKSTPFKHTGLDYFGPLHVKHDEQDNRKVWVCLFTCVVVRAVHLEIVNDLTAEEFLMALRRFIARRGKPEEIISDNASQFKLSKSTIDIAWEKAIKDPSVQSYVSGQGIKWNFIIELSPWMGGFYERLVGSSKMALRKTIGKNRLTSIQLQTFLAETEAVLNSRPLVYVGDELNDGIVITPSHFISPNTKTGVPTIEDEYEKDDPDFEPNQLSSKKVLLQVWKKGQRLLESFWKIWKTDYLLSLRERSKLKLKSPRIESDESPKVGDIVQLKEDLPRGSWKLGRITELITSNDGNTRAAKVLLPTKNVVNRSINLLYPLECDRYEESEEQKEDKTDSITEEENAGDLEKLNKNNKVIVSRPKRKAAQEARDKIFGQTFVDD